MLYALIKRFKVCAVKRDRHIIAERGHHICCTLSRYWSHFLVFDCSSRWIFQDCYKTFRNHSDLYNVFSFYLLTSTYKWMFVFDCDWSFCILYFHKQNRYSSSSTGQFTKRMSWRRIILNIYQIIFIWINLVSLKISIISK